MNLRHRAFLAVAVIALVLATACSREPQAPPPSGSGAEYAFHGIWTATGTRDTVSLGGDRRASIASFNGSLVLSGSSRPNVGFRAEAIVFSDSSTGGTGRAVWTDQRGDHVFSELRGNTADTKSKIVGTFVGGTGRYAGATGTYEFSWNYLVQNEEGIVQGQSTGLNGRIRLPSLQVTPGSGGSPQS